MRRPVVAGNWKMHGSTEFVVQLLDSLIQHQQDVVNAELIVFPPYVYLPQVAQALSSSAIAWGAQNVSHAAQGAFTGEVSVSMLRDFACSHVIVGHSERRHLYAETNDIVAQKFAAVIAAQMAPILCVGETLEQREQGDTLNVIKEQIQAVLALDLPLPQLTKYMFIAYEPVWAIGTGKTATPQQAQEVHEYIRSLLAQVSAELADQVRILYGGSVKPDNAKALFAMADIDGGLVGGASLDAEQFIEIGKQCNN